MKNWKKTLYILTAVFGGISIMSLVHSGIEFWYLGKVPAKTLLMQPRSVWGIGVCILPKYLQIILPLAGAGGGFLVGRSWWRSVYENRESAVEEKIPSQEENKSEK